MTADLDALVAELGLMPPTVWSEYEYTLGNFANEEYSAAAFDRAAGATGLFEILTEVQGEYMLPKMLTDSGSRRCRIDRILMPTKKLLDSGWPHGPVGVEIEASRMKVGGIICQCLDYHRAVWHLDKRRRGYHIMIEWVAIWPYGGGVCGTGSIMAQHRICGAWGNSWRPFVLASGGRTGLSFHKDGKVDAKGFNSGAKTGHRGRKG